MNKFTFYKTMMMVALLFATTVLSHAAVGDKWKEGKLYYKVTAEGTPSTVEVVPQNDSYPKWSDAEKPTGDLTIPATVTHVGITYDVTSIGERAFFDCYGLTSISIPNSVTSIGMWAFFDCYGFTSISISNSVTSIGMWAFFNCYRLTSVTIPNSVTSIGNGAFNHCRGLTSVTIPNSVTSIGEAAFDLCERLTAINVDNANTAYISQDGVLFNKDKTTLIEYPAGKTEASYAIPNSVTSIGNSAFSSCSGLTSVTIPNSVTSIGNSAFSSCSGLTSVTIPNSVTSIGNEAFGYCSNLTFIFCFVLDPANITTMGYSVFSSVSKEPLLCVPAGSVGAYQAADQWKEFTNIKEIASATGVTLNANTKTLILGEDFTLAATVVPNNAIPNVTWSSNNTAVATVDNGGKVSAVAEGDAIITVTTQDGGLTATCAVTVTIVGYKFKHTDGLYYKVTAAGTPNTVEVVPQKDDYPYWDDAEKPTGDLTIPATVTYKGITYNVTSIGEATFYECIGLTSISIPNSVTSIGKAAFVSCSGLTSISIHNSVTSIEEAAFGMCERLTAINVDNANTAYISQDGVLFNKDKTTLIQYPAGKTEASYAIPNSVTSIGNGAFAGCKILTSVSIPNSVTSIGEYAFSYCSGLTAIEVDNASTAYISQDGVLFNKDKTTLVQYPAGKTEASYAIPNSVTSIGKYAFDNCKGLSSVTISNSVTSIGDMVFLGCSGLTSVTCLVANPASITLVGWHVFDDVPGTATLYVPTGSMDAYKVADQWKEFTNIQEINIEVTDVILSASAKTLKVGQEFTLTATVQPDNATNKAVTWASSDETVATVDDNGKVTAVKAGSAIITVTTVDGSKTAECKVTVGGVPVENIALNKTNKTLKIGEEVALVATITPSNATNKAVTWASSDAAVATVDNGKVKALKVGKATITVKTEDGSKIAECKVTVERVPVESIALNKTSKTLKIGEEFTLVATITPSNATNKAVTWKSSDKTVATVDANGTVKAVKEGKTTITVKTVDGSKTAECNVTVDNNTGIGDIENTSEFVLYPTLVQTGFTIKFANETPKSVMLNIYTLSGAKISSEIINSQKQYVNISNLQKGIYIVKIKSHSVKIVKE